MIDVCLEAGDRHGAGQARHCDHAVIVGDSDRVAGGRVDGDGVHFTVATAARPCPQVDGDLPHVGSGQIVDRNIVGVLTLCLELDALDTVEIDIAPGTCEHRPGV